ncbi:hypothetical protein IVA86_27405 [Bradyrhizobium sp. 146]|uniref:hypothetical protein n=1 Tax=Bradyrhizobium sp. 146 TaxID=2782622 RepID=UPI001FFBCF84|nr:hypothetical protein [Bradyrhizobium sp. 146]MCK1705033.1 hypothetical protein [Bradyrhizobium sp. 146]
MNSRKAKGKAPNSEPDSPRIWKYKSTDLAGLAAFALSIFGYAWYIANWVKGADVQFFPPDQVELRCSEVEANECTAESKVTITASTMSYVNRGDPAYNAVLRREQVEAKFGDKQIVLDWTYFSDISSTSAPQKVATPRVISGGQSESHETRFYPRLSCAGDNCDRSNFLAWSELLKVINQKDSPLKSISMKFLVTLFDSEKRIEKSCVVTIDQGSREQFAKQGAKLFAKTLPCVSTAAKK